MNMNTLLPSGAVSITPSDTASNVCSGLYIGEAGDVAVVGENGVGVTFTAVPVGTILPIRCARVLATGTTAGGLVGFCA